MLVCFWAAPQLPESTFEGLFAFYLRASAPVFWLGNIVSAGMLGLVFLGLGYWILVGNVVGLGSVWLYFGILHRSGRQHRRRTYLVVALVVGLILTSAIASEMTKNSRIFRRYVFKPIPMSVKDIKIHRPWEASGHRYVIHFKISKADIEPILSSRPFEECDWIKYEDGKLYLPDGESLHLYAPYAGEPDPPWFIPNEWPNPKAYSHCQSRRISGRVNRQILINNEQLAEAYFIDYLEGTW